MTSDAWRIVAAQALRAWAYGFGSVLLGVSLEARGWSSTRVGLLLTAVVGGTALMSLAVARFADRVGRRRFYALLFVALSVTGSVFAFADSAWALFGVALLGALSTEVLESGPFTSLEQAMLPSAVDERARTRVFGAYNAIAAVAGSVGALAAGGPAFLGGLWRGAPSDQRFFLVLVPVGVVGAVVATRLSDAVELAQSGARRHKALRRSRPAVVRLAGLFAVDSFAGGFVVQSFIAYWFRLRFDVALEALGVIFFFVGLVQAASFVAATRIADRVGLLNTMVFTHLPSNLLLAAIPLAPTLPIAVALLLCRFALSQMDVPTRQAYVVFLVDPEERTAAAAYTNVARYLTRPLGPALAGAVQQVALGLPFFVAGTMKVVYDLVLWRWFRRVPLVR